MSGALAPFPNAESPAETAAAPRLERQLAILGEIAEIGLDMARALQAQVGEGSVQPASAAVAYGRVARAVRLTIALQTRLIAEANQPAPDQQREERRARVQRIVRRVIGEETDDAMEAAWRRVEAHERLEHDDIYGDVLTRPASEIIAEVCDDLGVSPDWAQLAAEAWAREEIATGAPGRPLAPDDDDDLDDDFDDDGDFDLHDRGDDPHAASP